VIPFVIPPLQDASILVTRPAPQAISLATRIQQLGGEALLLPAIAIEPLACEPVTDHDLVIFVSSNAVEYGARRVGRTEKTRIAAIGKSTAAALQAMQIAVDVVPEAESNSEALLAHPDLGLTQGSRILIVRGIGGRTLLQESFAALGMSVQVLEVYRRVLPPIDAALRASLEERWRAGELDIVTVTSVETLTNLAILLGDDGMLREIPLLVASPRIGDAARTLGLQGEIVLANGADDESLLGALSYWRARARGRVFPHLIA